MAASAIHHFSSPSAASAVMVSGAPASVSEAAAALSIDQSATAAAAPAVHHFSSLPESSPQALEPAATSHKPQATSASEASPQLRVAAALAQGMSVSAAARDAGIHRTTIHHWQRTSEDFRAAIEEARAEFVESLRDELRDLSYAAIRALQDLISNPNTPPSVRLKAALAVLERPQFPKRGWNLPERIETDRERYVVDGMAELEADYQAIRMTEAIRKHDERDAPPANATEPRRSRSGSAERREPVHSIHEPHATRCEPREAPLCARNSLCPCGSGQKYKRCCGKNAPPVIY